MYKRKIVAVGIAVFLLPLMLWSDEWYAFDITQRMDPQSPFNMSHLLDAPAGRHGFVTVREDGFVFEDGTPARFWGTNLNFSANFPSHEDARFLVERLAFFGFNAVRISHIDSNFEPAGIFKDIDPGLDTQDKVTGVLSSEQLDRLDYLIYTLKKQGIYVSFNLLIGRKFTEADGVKKARDLGEAAKPVTFFDPVLKRLQKKFAKDLLTHFNPYTGLRYCDDAAVSFIEIINEASLVKSWKADKLNVPLFSNEGSYIPVTYIWKLDHLWSIWLKNKYQTSENLRKSWGISEKGVLENIIVSDNAEWKLDVFSDARAELKRKKKSTIVLVKEATGTGWHVQYRMRGLKLAAGKIYVIRFTASSSSDFRLSLHAQKNEEPWQSLGLWQDIVITPKQKKYEIAFMLESENDNAQICFLAGYDSGKIKFSGLEIVEKDVTYLLGNSQDFLFQRPVYSAIELYPQQAQKDIVDFYISLQKEFFEEMTAFLRKECSIRIPVTGLGGVLVKEDILSQKNSDFIDYHAYWDHPAFANGWSKNDFSMHRKSTMSDPQLGIVGMICEIQDLSGNKPFTISEWQHCYPNRFAYETPVVLASYAVRNGWDALYQFSFSHSREKLRDSDMKSFFDSSANPQQMILTAVASLIYHKAQIKDGSLILKDKAFIIDLPFLKGVIGSIKEKNFAFDAFDLKPHGNGAVLIFSPDHSPLELADKWLMVAVGEVKNKSSVWKKKGQFKWGRSPVMMKNIGVDVALKVDRFFQVYSLSDEGRSAHQIPADKTLHDFVFSTAHASSPWYAVTQHKESPGTLFLYSGNDFFATGHSGGPFSPSMRYYSLKNIGKTSVKWKVYSTEEWVSILNPEGKLDPGKSVPVYVVVNDKAQLLNQGQYSGLIYFVNCSNDLGSMHVSASLNISRHGLAEAESIQKVQ